MTSEYRKLFVGFSSCDSNNSFEIPSGDIYEVRVKKYDYRGNEIKSTSDNYFDGVLHYYVNTLGDDSDSIGYSVDGAYLDATKAMNNPASSRRVSIYVTDSDTSYIKYCYTKEVSCTPNKMVYEQEGFKIEDEGLWRIIINEYDDNGYLIGGESRVWYSNILYNSGIAIIPTAESHCRDVTYTGSNVILTKSIIEGYYFLDNVKSAPGTYPITAVLQDGYVWSDGTKTNKIFYCTLKSK